MSSVKKRDASASIKKIMETAQKLFAEKGYHLTTLSEIGERSGLSRTTPSYFFKNKEMLYREIIKKLIEDEKEYVNKLDPKEDLTAESLKTLLTLHMSYTFRNPDLAKIMMWESLNENRQDWMLEYFPEMTSWSHKYLERAKKQGLIRKDIDTYILWLNALAMAWLPLITQHTFFKAINKEVFDEDFIQNHIDQVKTIIFESILV